MKECKRCNKWKDKKYFHKGNRMKDKLNSWCKDCVREYQREYYKANRERLLIYLKKYKIMN